MATALHTGGGGGMGGSDVDLVTTMLATCRAARTGMCRVVHGRGLSVLSVGPCVLCVGPCVQRHPLPYSLNIS
jgi:hypothetical protein